MRLSVERDRDAEAPGAGGRRPNRVVAAGAHAPTNGRDVMRTWVSVASLGVALDGRRSVNHRGTVLPVRFALVVGGNDPAPAECPDTDTDTDVARRRGSTSSGRRPDGGGGHRSAPCHEEDARVSPTRLTRGRHPADRACGGAAPLAGAASSLGTSPAPAAVCAAGYWMAAPGADRFGGSPGRRTWSGRRNSSSVQASRRMSDSRWRHLVDGSTVGAEQPQRRGDRPPGRVLGVAGEEGGGVGVGLVGDPQVLGADDRDRHHLVGVHTAVEHREDDLVAGHQLVEPVERPAGR